METYGHDPQVVVREQVGEHPVVPRRTDGARRACDHALGLAEDAGHALSHDTATIFASLLALDLDDPMFGSAAPGELLGLD